MTKTNTKSKDWRQISQDRLAVKTLKVAEFASEETLCYEATFTFDGVPAFRGKNGGTGGPDDYEPISYEKESGPQFRERMAPIEAWAKTFPPLPSEHFEDGLEMDLELLVGLLISDEQALKRAKRQLKNRIIYSAGDGLHEYPFNTKNNKRWAARNGGRSALDRAFRAKIAEEHGDAAMILNDIPIGEAARLLSPLS